MDIRSKYSELYNKLKGEGLDSILSNEFLDSYQREIVKIIARLPDPLTASMQEITKVCQLCTSGELEILFGVESIGETARGIKYTINEMQPVEQVSEILPMGRGELADIFFDQTVALNRLTLAVNSMSSKFDLNLKGRCPYCHGDLVEAIIDQGGNQPMQLILQCRQQKHPRCQAFEWYLQDVREKKQ